MAEQHHGGLGGRAQFGFTLRADSHSMQHPAAPTADALEQSAPASVTVSVEVRELAMLHGSANTRGVLDVQLAQQVQEAVPE